MHTNYNFQLRILALERPVGLCSLKTLLALLRVETLSPDKHEHISVLAQILSRKGRRIITAYTNTSTILSTTVRFVGSEVRNYQTVKSKLKGNSRKLSHAKRVLTTISC